MIANVKILREKPKRFYCSSGEADRELFIMDGDHLVAAGLENTQELIDSFEDSCDLKQIIDRVAQGEYDLLTKRTGMFIDTTIFPTMVCDIKNSIRDSKALFDSLDDDIKKSLGGSFEKFSKMSDDSYKQWIEDHSHPIVEPSGPIDFDIPIEGGNE